ncbi:DinB family protein [Humibacter ginsenosidimutans]|uniref:DinB family protein n=1 Tax=Humibacter ginsenosidimutans TaxID=2599293 RepID=A0A5B8M612_9MICO|nr:DinB family protein [Humibacter ginsenosidimutans]QDZ15404.1 DinB family protein [Humibacter ginsenosidimutans]
MPIVPETKSWTWVLERRCPECGFDASAIEYRDVPAMTRENADAWMPVLERADVSARPDDSTWSPLEYAAHVRDVYDVMAGRLRLLLEQDDPAFENWDQDATAIAGRYGEQDPAAVADELHTRAYALADAWAAVPDSALGRSGRRSDGSVFTVESLARYFIHDPVHHLWDVRG